MGSLGIAGMQGKIWGCGRASPAHTPNFLPRPGNSQRPKPCSIKSILIAVKISLVIQNGWFEVKRKENKKKFLIEKSKYLGLIAVIALLLSFGLALFWGVAKAITAWSEIISSLGQSSEISLLLIKLIDAFLVAMVLYLLAASIYKMFIGDLELPSQLVANNLLELKSKLSSIMVLVIAVRFVESLFGESMQPLQVMWLALASTLVAGTLVAFGYFSNKNEKGE